MSRMAETFLGDDLFDFDRRHAETELPKPAPRKAFDGDTYEVSRDYLRLDCQLGQVFALMKDGKWRTLPDIANHVEGSEAAISARLRDLRKEKYGGHLVERNHIANGLFEYRLIIDPIGSPLVR